MSVLSALEERTALVTGAAGTMGRAAVVGLLADGIRVAMADINARALEKAFEEVAGGRSTDRLYSIAFDIADSVACSGAVEQIQREFGPIDVLVNNAGILSNPQAEFHGHARG